MLQKLVRHNDDIRRLVEKGYAVGFDSNCLIIRDIPYLDDQRRLQIGAIVAKLVFIDETRVTQDDHQIYFAGGVPHTLEGKPIPNLGGGATTLSLAADDVVVQRSFSNKPRDTGKFIDFFAKIESYVAIISGPAMELHGGNPYTFRIVDGGEQDSVFKVRDTWTSLAEISDLSAKFREDIVTVIGLGGTGAYVLDLLVKTPVREIRVFDLDRLYLHNAFRSPGRLNSDELGCAKTEVYASRYDNFRKGIVAVPKFVDATCHEDLNGVTFAFVCVDKGSARAEIFNLLLEMRIPFIDVGMGLRRTNGSLNGTVRTTYYSVEDGQARYDQRLAPLADGPDDIYRTNVQIAELNALNACLAVIRFKQLRGFYLEEEPQHHLVFEVSDLKIVSASPDED